jgi:hypothetical protein
MPTQINRSHIVGWGADLDPADRPAYPMERTPPRLDVPWDQPEQQRVRPGQEVLLSVEYPGMRPLFGTSVPPTGVSGAIRRAAFKLSENDIRHWLMLLFADRVNVVEGILDDLRRGHIPNIFAEMGWKAKYRYNKRGFFTKVTVMAALVGIGVYYLARLKQSESD